MQTNELSYTSREQVEVYRFTWPVAVGIPIAAIVLQAFIPVRLYFFRAFDLPLLVTIFFSISRRSPISGLLTGAAIGLTQDCLSHNLIGMSGIAKTVVGYAASSLGVKIDVENPGSRFLMTFAFYAIHQVIYFSIARGMAAQTLDWHWGQQAAFGVANSLMAVFLFTALDKFKQRT
jgi:rod shape-determining protein MreD